MPSGYLAIVLHAHLPDARRGDGRDEIAERWLFESIWECYVPLLDALQGLQPPHGVTLSLSPTLLDMWRDERLMNRFDSYAKQVCALALSAANSSPDLEAAARNVIARMDRARNVLQALGGNLVEGFRGLASKERIELLTTSATHAFLPIFETNGHWLDAQIHIGRAVFAKSVGWDPAGMWLPECAVSPRILEAAASAGAKYAVADTHAILLAHPWTGLGNRAPILTPEGIALFPRDSDASVDVWSRELGYPGHPDYREFHDEVRDPDAPHLPTGVKLRRVDRMRATKRAYDPEMARARTVEHARHFLSRRLEGFRASPAWIAPPLSVAPFDAELFGHWWYEGPAFLSEVIAQAQGHHVELITLGQYLARHPDLVSATPASASWGERGYSETWIHPSNAEWIRVLRRLGSDAEHALLRADGERSLGPLREATRHLLSAQASDYPFMIRGGEMKPYAQERLGHHVQSARAWLVGGASNPSPPKQPLFSALPLETILRSMPEGLPRPQARTI